MNAKGDCDIVVVLRDKAYWIHFCEDYRAKGVNESVSCAAVARPCYRIGACRRKSQETQSKERADHVPEALLFVPKPGVEAALF